MAPHGLCRDNLDARHAEDPHGPRSPSSPSPSCWPWRWPCPAARPAQTKDDTLVYALQSDIDSWDPPNSVLREAIILGYHVFDHLAVRDLKTRKVGPNLARRGSRSTTRPGRSSSARA